MLKMKKRGKDPKEDHIITLRFKNVEQLIHAEPMFYEETVYYKKEGEYEKKIVEIHDGFMIITIEPVEGVGNTIKSATMRMYSYSNKYEFYFSGKAEMVESNPGKKNHVHLIKIDIDRRPKKRKKKNKIDKIKLKVKSVKNPCAIWTSKDENFSKINDLQLNRQYIEGVTPFQICEYRWVQ